MAVSMGPGLMELMRLTQHLEAPQQGLRQFLTQPPPHPRAASRWQPDASSAEFSSHHPLQLLFNGVNFPESAIWERSRIGGHLLSAESGPHHDRQAYSPDREAIPSVQGSVPRVALPDVSGNYAMLPRKLTLLAPPYARKPR
jgi:hypothetical protein